MAASSSTLFLISCSLVLVLVTCGTVPIKDCGSQSGKVTSFSIEPAPVGSCTFPRGKNVTAIVEMELDEETSKLTAVCKGDVVVWVPFPLPNNDACTQGVTCPTKSGSKYTFKTQLPIRNEYPAIRLVVQMEFQDDKGKDAICFRFPAQIC